MDAALASLVLLPPGAEAEALAALDWVLAEGRLALLLDAAHTELLAFQVGFCRGPIVRQPRNKASAHYGPNIVAIMAPAWVNFPGFQT